jgi:hypothetical protein
VSEQYTIRSNKVNWLKSHILCSIFI